MMTRRESTRDDSSRTGARWFFEGSARHDVTWHASTARFYWHNANVRGWKRGVIARSFSPRVSGGYPKNNGDDHNDTEGYRKQKITARAIVEMRYTKGKMKENARRCGGDTKGWSEGV